MNIFNETENGTKIKEMTGKCINNEVRDLFYQIL